MLSKQNIVGTTDAGLPSLLTVGPCSDGNDVYPSHQTTETQLISKEHKQRKRPPHVHTAVSHWCECLVFVYSYCVGCCVWPLLLHSSYFGEGWGGTRWQAVEDGRWLSEEEMEEGGGGGGGLPW